MKFEIPKPAKVFPDFKDQIVKDRWAQFFPPELRPLLLKLSYLGAFTEAVSQGKVRTYSKRELNTILNPDLSRFEFLKLPAFVRQKIIKSFANEDVVMPTVFCDREMKKRWILTDRFTLVYNFWFLNNTNMRILEISNI